MKILISTAEWVGTLTLMRSFAHKGHKIALIGNSECTPSLHSKFCSQYFISPREKNKDAYIKFLFEIIRQNKFDLFVPMSDLCTEYCSEMRSEISRHVRIFLPEHEDIVLTLNKDRMYRFASDHQISIPKTYFLQNLADAKSLIDTLDYPCLIKETKGAGGCGNTYIADKKDIISFFDKKPSWEQWPMIQEFINGEHFSFTSVCQDGKILEYFMYDIFRHNNGITVRARSEYNEKIYRIVSKLINLLKWTGAIGIDFLIPDNGEPIFLEINPRFPATTQFAYSCGVDLPARYLSLALGESQNRPQKPYKLGMTYRALFTQEIMWIKKRRNYLPSFFLDLLRPNVHYDFSLCDPKLLLWQIKNAKWTWESPA